MLTPFTKSTWKDEEIHTGLTTLLFVYDSQKTSEIAWVEAENSAVQWNLLMTCLDGKHQKIKYANDTFFWRSMVKDEFKQEN